MTVARLRAAGSDDRDATLDIDYGERGELPEAFHALVEYTILASAPDPFDPMEKAFHRLGEHFLANTENLHRDWTLAHGYGLTPELRAMAQVWKARDGDDFVVAAKGRARGHRRSLPPQPGCASHYRKSGGRMASDGLRVLAAARPLSRHDGFAVASR